MKKQVESLPNQSKARYSVLICAGGTGGHIFPAQALGQQLSKRYPDVEVVFVGGGLGANPYFDRRTFSFREVNCGTMSLRKPLRSLRSLGKIVRGFFESRQLLRHYKPDLVVGFGSYYTLPPLLAAKAGGIPIALHAADSIPGKVIRLFSPYVSVTGIHFPEAAGYLRGKSLEVGMPLREGFHKSSIGRRAAQEYFDLDPKRLTLLVFGGSQGAAAINRLVVEALCQHLPEFKSAIQIVHYVGTAKNVEQVRNTYQEHGIRCCVKEFETRMDFAWNAADLAISRAGASSIAEQIEFEVPGILIPYPHAADNHQDKNAEFLSAKVGGALKFSESQLTPKILAEAIRKLLQEDGNLLKGMQRAIHQYKHRPSQKDFCSVLYEMLTR